MLPGEDTAMPELVVMGATLKCDQGMAPCKLIVLPVNKTLGCNVPAATVMDFAILNIPTFGMCKGTNSANPAVAAATSAASGTPTPAPCLPVVAGPWSPGASKVKINNLAALTKSCTCKCAWAGTISVSDAGQTKIQVT